MSCPAISAGWALPAIMSCTGRSGLINKRSSRCGSCSSRFGLLYVAKQRAKPSVNAQNKTDDSLRQSHRVVRRRLPVALTIVRGRIQRRTCWRRFEIARACCQRFEECPAPWFSSSRAIDLFRRPLPRDRRLQPSPSSAYELHWSHFRPVLSFTGQ